MRRAVRRSRLIYGIMIGDGKVLVVPKDEGRPIVESPEPEAPEGYESKCSYVDAGTEIRQVWSLAPKRGTEADAAVALAKIQAQSLDDAQALEVAALYDEWSGDGVEYKKGDRRRFQGLLVKCLQDHTSQPDWAPNAAPSLSPPLETGEGLALLPPASCLLKNIRLNSCLPSPAS